MYLKPKDERFKVICAWCKCHIRGDEDAPRVSHGMCTSCVAEQLKELQGPPVEEVLDKVWGRG